MPSEGAGPDDVKAQQVTNDEFEDWFPHISPDGKWMVFLSFPKGVKTHNDKMEGVSLRLMRAPGKNLKPAKIEILKTFFGGQGTINVNSGRRIPGNSLTSSTSLSSSAETEPRP